MVGSYADILLNTSMYIYLRISHGLIEHLTGKINQRLGLLKRIKHLLPFRARLLFYKSLVMPLFEYADLVWGDKHNITLMSSLQVLQNKAAKVILNRPLYSSSTEAWLISWYILMF